MMRYKEDVIKFHSMTDNSNIKPPDPSLFKISEEAYLDMVENKQNQAIIISGESGAGKTEACKRILK